MTNIKMLLENAALASQWGWSLCSINLKLFQEWEFASLKFSSKIQAIMVTMMILLMMSKTKPAWSKRMFTVTSKIKSN